MSVKHEPDEKKKSAPTTDDKKQSVLSKESVKLMGESVGYSDLSNEAAALLSQDVSYRLRDVLQGAYQFMKHAKRKKLTTSDLNKALMNSHVEPVYGHTSEEPLVFHQVKDTNIHFVDDVNINVTSLSHKCHSLAESAQSSLKASWLVLEGVQHNVLSNTSGKISESKPGVVADELASYYDNITQALLGNDEELTKIVLNDLRTNHKLSPLVPHFCSFIANGVKTVSYDVHQLTKLLYMVHSLIRNPALYLLHHPYLTLLTQAVTYCLVEPLPLAASPSDNGWLLRDYAAFLLAFMTRACETATNNLFSQTVLSLQTVLRDENRPLCSHYGALRAITLLGPKAVEEVLFAYIQSRAFSLLCLMEEQGHCQQVDASRVHGALLVAAEVFLKSQWVDRKIDPAKRSASQQHDFNKIYTNLYSYFGDSFIARLPQPEAVVCLPAVHSPRMQMTDVSVKQTGEDLLEQFLREPHEVQRGQDEDMEHDDKSESKSCLSGNSEDTSFATQVSMSVKSSVTDPEKGIKMTISMKRPGSGGVVGEKFKKRKLGHHSRDMSSDEWKVSLIEKKPIVIRGFKVRPVADTNRCDLQPGCEKMGRFRQLSFAKSIIGKMSARENSGSFKGVTHSALTLI